MADAPLQTLVPWGAAAFGTEPGTQVTTEVTTVWTRCGQLARPMCARRIVKALLSSLAPDERHLAAAFIAEAATREILGNPKSMRLTGEGPPAMVMLLSFSHAPREYHDCLSKAADLAGSLEALAVRGYAVELVSLSSRGAKALVAREQLEQLKVWIAHSGDTLAGAGRLFVDPSVQDLVSCLLGALPKRHKK